jgi:predicted DsbA family dithiol-disulfide isomerase
LIGKTFLDRALEIRPDNVFTLEWHPYMLNPQMPKNGIDREVYLVNKFGSKHHATEVYKKIIETAVTHNIEINFNKIKRTPNTLDAHRLIHWASLEEKQGEAINSLFYEYFVKGKDIGNTDVLSSIASNIGMNHKSFKHAIKTNKDVKSISDHIKNAITKGVTGVPCFIVNNQYVLQGAQSTELWLKVIDETADHKNTKLY